MTSRGYRRMQEELQQLKAVERPRITRAIEEARAHGDLSENAEYDAAKNAQGMLEAKMRSLESKLASADVIEITSLSGSQVLFGATVKVLDCEADEEKTITIVGEDEGNVEKGLISFQAPLARALIGKKEGDIVEVRLPVGKKEFEILQVAFIEID